MIHTNWHYWWQSLKAKENNFKEYLQEISKEFLEARPVGTYARQFTSAFRPLHCIGTKVLSWSFVFAWDLNRLAIVFKLFVMANWALGRVDRILLWTIAEKPWRQFKWEGYSKMTGPPVKKWGHICIEETSLLTSVNRERPEILPFTNDLWRSSGALGNLHLCAVITRFLSRHWNCIG